MQESLDTLGSSAARPDRFSVEEQRLHRHINLLLIANGMPPVQLPGDSAYHDDAELLLARYHQRLKLLDEIRCPADARIEEFLAAHFADLNLGQPLSLPPRTIILLRHGVARELSLPVHKDTYENAIVKSYRVKNGILHNPLRDRRTTQGTFHIAEGGLPIPDDKKSVPKRVFAELFRHAWTPPADLLTVPFTADQEDPARSFVSLLIHPLVSPGVPGVCARKCMEIRFFAPAGLVSNLDFVESIFGNAGDPYLPDNDAALDAVHWSGHTGAVILAPHLCTLTKQELGLCHWDQASERQRRDGMCWRDAGEFYNDGTPFKITCRTETGVVITIIADNYFGYCKKEVKTQISYAANLFGNVEEEHAGGTLAFASFNLGEEFDAQLVSPPGSAIANVFSEYPHVVDVQPEGFGVDKLFPNLIYIPENAKAMVQKQRITWPRPAGEASIPLLPGKVYMTPSGYKVRMEKHPQAPTWRLIGTVSEGVVCHKPCTVSGGGKSEISKSLDDYMLYGPIFVAQLDRDLALVREVFDRDYASRWRDDHPHRHRHGTSRRVLDARRSLGSVIKLLTPSAEYNDEYNTWLDSIPDHVYAMAFVIKRFQRGDDWELQWQEQFGVDIVNGELGHELRYRNRKLVGEYLRVGLAGPTRWRTYKLRQDFYSAEKLQFEDDISVSTVIPRGQLRHLGLSVVNSQSYKIVANCEYRLFQRPDDAIHRGLDKKAESDLSRVNNFISNFEPLTATQVRQMAEYVVDLDKFTEPMRRLLDSVVDDGNGYVACSSSPRLIDGVPTENPRYLQDRPDLAEPMKYHVAQMGTRLARGVPAQHSVHFPVNSVLIGRRNNPPDKAKGIRSLAVYGPIHYQELPELFMDFVCSLTGKSPSTTGVGSEGALTKGPFNSLPPIVDLNATLVSFILTNLAGYSTPAGYIGSHVRVDHDISYLVPEVWCRLMPSERDPKFLIEQGMLEKIDDFDHGGQRILASRLGYRITDRFVRWFFGRVFDNPAKVFDEAILKPEVQDLDAFADGILYIADAHRSIAKRYFNDRSIYLACPPLQALLTIMAEGNWRGKSVQDPDVRSMFTAEYLLQSDWYAERLRSKQTHDIQLWTRNFSYLNAYSQRSGDAMRDAGLALPERLREAERQLQFVQSPEYLESLYGTIGRAPCLAYE
ncbi:MAG: hypothetical protein O2931_04345 [Planctomycetota bacterium]|nr:hypothetical protein [Planctomycetota bacterium]MDA1178011.1 hypothetical protein [Planctomycetota bacterium]